MPEALRDYLGAVQTRIEEELAFANGSSIYTCMLAMGACADGGEGGSRAGARCRGRCRGPGAAVMGWVDGKQQTAAPALLLLLLPVPGPARANLSDASKGVQRPPHPTPPQHPHSHTHTRARTDTHTPNAENDSSTMKKRRKMRLRPCSDAPGSALMSRFLTNFTTTAMARSMTVCRELQCAHGEELAAVAGGRHQRCWVEWWQVFRVCARVCVGGVLHAEQARKGVDEGNCSFLALEHMGCAHDERWRMRTHG